MFKCLENKNSYNSGSTCVVTLIYNLNNVLTMEIINLGDSRCGIIHKNKKFEQITIDHNPANITEKERIEKMGGVIIEDCYGIKRINGLSVSCGLGDAEITYVSHTPDIFRKTISSNIKYIILHCDGLVEQLTNNEISEFLFHSVSKNKAKSLCNYAYKKGSEDNISVILLEL